MSKRCVIVEDAEILVSDCGKSHWKEMTKWLSPGKKTFSKKVTQQCINATYNKEEAK